MKKCRASLFLSLIFMTGACVGNASNQQRPRGRQTDPIILDVTPFGDPVAVSVVLRGDAESEVVRYSPPQLTISAVRRGVLPEGAFARLRAAADAPAFRAALSQEGNGGTRVEEGDLFRLAVESGGRPAAGLVSKAAPAVQGFIKEVLALEEHLTRVPPAEAYLRSERIEPGRLEAIRRRGLVRLAPLGELPPDLRPAVAQAAEQPLRFHPLSRAQYDRLLTQCSVGHELFLVVGDAGHQLTLFSARP